MRARGVYYKDGRVAGSAGVSPARSFLLAILGEKRQPFEDQGKPEALRNSG
jgi:hypothetical protein